MNESKRYDCSRGCTVERAESGEIMCNYRQGCCKLEVYDWLDGGKIGSYGKAGFIHKI